MPYGTSAPPDPKEVIDSIGDGVSQLITVGPRLTSNMGRVATDVGEGFKSISAEVERRMLDDPSVLPDAVIKGAGTIVRGVVDTVEGTVGAVSETAAGIKSNINRVLK